MKLNEIQQAFNSLNAKYLNALRLLEAAYEQLDAKPKEVIKEVPVEKIVQKLVIKKEEVPVEVVREVEKDVFHIVEKESTNDLKTAARLLAKSEFNKEDLPEQEIYDMLIKMSEDEVRAKIGFWATPLPQTDNKPSSTQTYKTNK